MNPGPSRVRRAVTLLVALVLVGILYLLSQLPTLSSTEAEAIAARFRFEKIPFPEPAGFPHKTVRQVHPSVAHLSAYLSALGASVALGDIDGDGLPNDLCYVDPRTDQVVIAPAPGSPGDRYEPFVLQPGPLAYDSTMAPTGCLLGDFNEDGLTDVLVIFWGRSPILYLQQPAAEGGKRLTARSFIPCELVSPWQRWFSCAATQFGPDRLLHNRSEAGKLRFALLEGERGLRLVRSGRVMAFPFWRRPSHVAKASLQSAA